MKKQDADGCSRQRVAFCTFGCRLNQYDTEAMRTQLEAGGGWQSVPLRENADLYVVNTCSVTSRADARARQAIRRIHEQQPEARIAVTGCYAQRAPEEIAGIGGVSVVMGTADRGRIVQEVEQALPGEKRVSVSPIETAREFLEVPVTEMMERSRAYVKVQEGCDQHCAFCIIPQTRGRSRSRRPENVLDQIRQLVDSGYGEIVLTGVDIGSYGVDLDGGQPPLNELLRRILAVKGLRRLRLSSIGVGALDKELIAMMAMEEKFARHLHIPLQSGSDRVLAKMRRPYSVGQFQELIHRIGEQVPGCGLGIDVICGFPGETEAEFQQTFDLLADLPISYLHPFTYSERPGSAAASFQQPVPGDERKRRTRALKRLSSDKNEGFRKAHLGQEMQVLVEPARGKSGAGVSGWTDNYIRVNLEREHPEGELVTVCIEDLTNDGLIGRPMTSRDRGHAEGLPGAILAPAPRKL